MCLVKRTRRIVGDAERSQTTTYYCPRSRNGRTCSLTRYEDVEKRYQESSKVISPETSRRRRSTTKTKDSIWKVLSSPFSKERTGKAYDNQARSNRDQQATSHPQAQPPLSTQPDNMRNSFRPPEQADHRRIVSTPLVIDRSPRETVERVRPATAPAPKPARPPRPRTPVEERPRVRQHPVYVHQNEPVAERHPIFIHQLEPEPARRHPVSTQQTEPESVRIEMTGGHRPASDIDDHFSTFATFPSSSSSSSSEVVTEFDEEDESYENDTIDEPYRPRPQAPEVEGTLGRRRDREYLNARLEALQAQRRMEDAIRERREIENLANDVRHVLISGRAGGAGAGTLTRRPTNPVRESRPMITAPPERAGDTTEDIGGFRRHSTVIARRNFTPPSYVIQEENRRVREESERVIENARARRNTQDPLDPAPFIRERHGGSNWRQSYYR